jgi:hypothetical protein
MPVELSGVDELRKALKQYAPDLDKQLKNDLTLATQNVVNAARGFVPATPPLSNWGREGGNFPIYNAATIRNGIRLSTARSKINKNGFASSVRIVNANAAGAIYETAGRAGTTSRNGYRSNNPGAGAHFVSRMGPLYGEKREERGRMIFRAWAEDQGKAQAAVIKAIENTVNAFNQGSYTKAA